MGSHKTFSCSTSRITPPVTPVPPPTPYYVVTGNPDPDSKGNYYLTGTHNGKPYYKHQTLTFVLWWDQDSAQWKISLTIFDLTDCWKKLPGEEIPGTYIAYGEFEGTATVSLGA